MHPQPNPTTAVNPSPASVAALAARTDDDAIIMVNLLRYEPAGGREAYARYGAVAVGTVRARGGSIAYTAPVLGPGPAWDAVTLVRYPRRAAYLDMQRDPAYVGAIPDRTRGLAARLLYPFHPVGGEADDSFRIERPTGEEVIEVSLFRFRRAEDRAVWKPDGDLQLRLQGDVPMVSDGVWDDLVVVRHSSPEAVPTRRLGPGSPIEAAITLVTRPAG